MAEDGTLAEEDDRRWNLAGEDDLKKLQGHFGLFTLKLTKLTDYVSERGSSHEKMITTKSIINRV